MSRDTIGGMLGMTELALLSGRDRHRPTDRDTLRAAAVELRIPELRTQLDRAIYDLEHGWPEAAYDVLVRARDYLAQEQAP